MRADVAFAVEQYQMSERQACKLVNVNRSSYRYEPGRTTMRSWVKSF